MREIGTRRQQVKHLRGAQARPRTTDMAEHDLRPSTEPNNWREPEPFAVEAAGQKLCFLPGGCDRRKAMMELVAGARESLDLCFYIYAEDETGTMLRDALIEAARRGVAVTLIVDNFGSSITDSFIRPLCESGGIFRTFSRRWTQRYLIRNHQKLMIADQKLALFGGFNIADSYFAPPQADGWTDLAIRIEGAAVAGLVDWFARLKSWTIDERSHFRSIRRTVRTWEWGLDGDRLRWLVGGPTKGLSRWAACVGADLIDGRRLDMMTAYFSPPRRLLKRIGRIAAKGETRLVLPSKSDNAVTLGAARSLYSYLLGRGAQVWEFTPNRLHTKLIVLDDGVYIGSANFDMRSLYLNLELMLRIEDRALAERMRAFIGQHVGASRRITPQLHASRASLWNRIRWNLGWLLVSVIDYTVTRRLNLGLDD